MNGERIKPRRVLGVVHILVGLASFVPAAMYALFQFAPLVLGPIWFCVLGVWLWRPTQRLSSALLATHLVMFVFAVLNVVYGIGALHSANQSAAQGGGLLGGVGW